MNQKWNYVTQDYDGEITLHDKKPRPHNIYRFWLHEDIHEIIQTRSKCVFLIPDWQDKLIDLSTHSYKIEDGILIQTEKKKESDQYTLTLTEDEIRVAFHCAYLQSQQGKEGYALVSLMDKIKSSFGEFEKGYGINYQETNDYYKQEKLGEALREISEEFGVSFIVATQNKK